MLHGNSGPRAIPAPLPPVQRAAVAQAFVAAITGDQPPLLDGRWGLESLAVCHALLLSARERREINPAELIEGLS